MSLSINESFNDKKRCIALFGKSVSKVLRSKRGMFIYYTIITHSAPTVLPHRLRIFLIPLKSERFGLKYNLDALRWTGELALAEASWLQKLMLKSKSGGVSVCPAIFWDYLVIFIHLFETFAQQKRHFLSFWRFVSSFVTVKQHKMKRQHAQNRNIRP